MQPLPLARYHFRVRMNDPLILPAFSGSLLRSVFGNALKQLACSEHSGDRCPEGCLFRMLFEPEPDTACRKRFPDIPPPYVIEPSDQSQVVQGSCLHFSMVLMGYALEYLPVVVLAWQQAFARGLGKERVTGQILEVYVETGDGPRQVYDGLAQRFQPHENHYQVQRPADGSAVVLQLLTPLQLSQKGRVLSAEALTAEHLARALLRRTQLIGELYLGLILPDWHRLREWIQTIELSSQLQWHRLERYSSRQGQAMKWRGLTGSLSLQGVCPELLSLLQLGEYLHLGKHSAFGFGRYRIHFQGKS